MARPTAALDPHHRRHHVDWRLAALYVDRQPPLPRPAAAQRGGRRHLAHPWRRVLPSGKAPPGSRAPPAQTALVLAGGHQHVAVRLPVAHPHLLHERRCLPDRPQRQQHHPRRGDRGWRGADRGGLAALRRALAHTAREPASDLAAPVTPAPGRSRLPGHPRAQRAGRIPPHRRDAGYDHGRQRLGAYPAAAVPDGAGRPGGARDRLLAGRARQDAVNAQYVLHVPCHLFDDQPALPGGVHGPARLAGANPVFRVGRGGQAHHAGRSPPCADDCGSDGGCAGHPGLPDGASCAVPAEHPSGGLRPSSVPFAGPGCSC